jgi:DHA1 family multidrug resistance protein-like MFS transporter
MSTSNRKNIAILSFALVVVTLGFGMVIPIFPFYIEKLGASGSDLGLLIATAALLEFLFAPIWGSISDRAGRRPILMIGMVGYGLSSLLFGLSTQLWMLYASRALSGLLSSATAATAMAYIGDSTSEEDRGSGIGMLGAAMGLGLIVGPGLGGWLGTGSLAMPFFISAGLALVALLLIFFLLPESLPAEARPGGKVRTVQFSELWRALCSPIGILLALLFLVSFGLTNFEAVFGLYAAEKLGYGPDRVGVILVVVGVASTLGKATLIGPLTRRWGEAVIIKASMFASSVGFLILLLANSYLTILLATGLFILSKTFLRTALLSLASRRSSLRQAQGRAGGQGAVMGLGNSFINLGRIAGPIWAGFIFDVNLSYPYLSGAAIMFIGFLIGLAWVSQGERKTTAEGWQPTAD